jgi:hypothetical protein
MALALAGAAAACSTPKATEEERLGAAEDALLFCGGEYCASGEVCCNANGVQSCMTSSECCVAKGNHICGLACVDTRTDEYNCGGCGIVCHGHCVNSVCDPVYVEKDTLTLGKRDLGVAANNRWVVASQYNSFAVLDRNAFLSPVFDTELSAALPADGCKHSTEACTANSDCCSGVCSQNTCISGAENLFRRFILDDTVDNMNKTLFQGQTTAVPCDWTKPFSTKATPPPGIVMGVDKETKQPIDWPSSSCIDDIYDTHVLYDTNRQRFWVLSQARNAIWDNSCDTSASTDTTLCNELNAQARRFLVLAVSKTSDPHDGFWKYIITNDYADWPVLGVNNDLAMIFHNEDGGFHVFDAGALASGTGAPRPTELLVNGKILQSGGVDFNGTHLRVPKHHEGATSVTYVVSTTGSDLWIYAFTSPHAAGAASMVGPAHWKDPQGRDMEMLDAAFANGNLYLTEAGQTKLNGNPVSNPFAAVWKVPITLSQVQNHVELAANSVQSWNISASQASVDTSTVDITSNGNVVLGYRAANPTMAPAKALYNVMYSGEASFSITNTLSSVSGTSGAAVGPADFFSSQRDTYYTDAVWTALADENGYLVSFIEP